MAATEKTALIRLETITWKELVVVTGGGGSGPDLSLSPYLWTIFFKIDGTSVIVADSFFLVGTATVEPAQGKHGDLGIWSISAGESVGIPDALGFWSTELVPFFIAVSAQPFFNLPNIPQPQAGFGCIAILLRDGGHIPPQAVDAGRQALTNGVQAFLDSELIEKLGVAQPGIPAGDMAAAQQKISDAVTNAMTNSLSFLEKVWAASGADEFIASWTISADAGQSSFTKVVPAGDAFSKWGIWELSASVTISDPCPAEAVAAIVNAAFGGEHGNPEPARGAPWSGQSLDAMRDFRDAGGLRDRPGLRAWWRTARRHTAEVAYILARDAHLRSAVAELLKALPAILKDERQALDHRLLKVADSVLDGLLKKGGAELKSAAVNARIELKAIAGMPLAEALDRLGRDAVRTEPPPQRSRSKDAPKSR